MSWPSGAATPTKPLAGACPDNYHVKAGLNVNFPIDGSKRAFIVVPPATGHTPAPVWVPLTGTVESTNDNLHVERSGANALMADSRFIIAAVRCVAKSYPLDATRLFIGGISSGGTMTHRALTFRSDFWAGGLPISGEWYVSQDDGSALSFDAAREAVATDPGKIFQGRVAPFPLPSKLNPMIVISLWGGANDLWKCSGVLCADYRPSTQAASNYFSSIPGVITISCSSSHGHMWPQINTQAFNLWALSTLASFPKGSLSKNFNLTTPPDGYSCMLGRFTDHY
jgi:hypothetical protein